MNKTLSRVAACTAAGFATALVAGSTLLSATAHAATGDTALYRMYSPGAGDHFYTTSAAERDFAVAHYGYRTEGVTGYVGVSSATGRTPLYRMYSKAAGDHFYTTSLDETNYAVAHYGYVNEGVTGYVGTSADASNTALYRTYSQAAGDHFYTAGADEKNYAVSKLSYRDEGVMGYVYNTGASQPVDPGQGGGTTTPSDPTKFDKVRISLTFDDGWKSIRQNGLPLLQKYGLTSTHYINSQPTLDNYSGYNTSADIKAIYDAGNEIAWHTNTHTYDLTTATAAQVQSEVVPTAPFLQMLAGINVPLSDNFAAPFGTVSAASVAAVTGAGFHSYRTTNDGYNTKANFDANNILVKNVCGADGLDACNEHGETDLTKVKATTPADISRWIDEAKATNAWLVIVYHEVGDFTRAQATLNNRLASCDNDPADAGADPNACVTDPSYAVTPENLDAELSIIAQAKANGSVLVETVKQALTELRAQITK